MLNKDIFRRNDPSNKAMHMTPTIVSSRVYRELTLDFIICNFESKHRQTNM